MNKHLLFILSILFSINAAKIPNWTVFIYMDSSNELSDMAIKNINDMLLAGSNKRGKILIQLHAFDNKAYRYEIGKKILKYIEQINLKGNSMQDLLDGANWAFKNHRAKHNMLILWNHGWGILDPTWDAEKKIWQIEPDMLGDIFFKKHKDHKGFVFNQNRKIYLTNQDLIQGLKTIKDEILDGNKLDILAFDTCMGALLEISYQIAPYVRYHVGCQNCELRDGFEYKSLCKIITSQNQTPKNIAYKIVDSFDACYKLHRKEKSYTLSAIDLSYIEPIKNSLDAVVSLISKCAKKYSEIEEIIYYTRQESPRFCFISMYTDLYVFFTKLHVRLSLLDSSTKLTLLLNKLEELKLLIKKAVVANCTGDIFKNRAHGFSIYFPFAHIDSSYYKTAFAQESNWLNFLNNNIQYVKKWHSAL